MREKEPTLFKRQNFKIIEMGSSPSTHLYFSLLLLTFAAGWVDAMTFLALGKVFSFFMSGNVLFLGIAAGQNDWDFMFNVMSALTAFGMGGVLAGLTMASERPSRDPDGLSRTALLLELAVLLIFACLWAPIADGQPNPARQAGLVGTVAFAMESRLPLYWR